LELENQFFGVFCELTATLTAYIFGTGRDK